MIFILSILELSTVFSDYNTADGALYRSQVPKTYSHIFVFEMDNWQAGAAVLWLFCLPRLHDSRDWKLWIAGGIQPDGVV